MKAPALGWQLASAFVLSLLVLIGLIDWLQNVHIITSNGMYKSIQAEPWIADPAHARLDPSNYLYFPLYGALARVLDALGILRGVPWKQFAYLNALWASLAVVFVYAFVHRVTGSAWAAVLAACFHFGCGFFLLLAVISEDIMPGYALVLGAMVLAGLWFDQPSHRRVALVGALFTLGWLIEWRLMFPTLPALVLALALSAGTAGAAAGADRHPDRLDPGRVRDRPAPVGGPQRRHGPARHPVDRQGRDHRLGRPLRRQGLDDAVGHRQLFPDRGRLGRSIVGQARRLAAHRLGAAAGGHPGGERRHALAATRRPALAGHRDRFPRHAGRRAGAELLRPAARPADADQCHAVAHGGVGPAAGRARRQVAR